MSNWLLTLIILFYLGLLFYVAYFVEKKTKNKWLNSPFIYALSFAVYCSAWTYYGSIGVAANKGVNFLTIYLGPIIAAPLWIIVLRKVVRISKQHKISSLADFISLRYGKNRFLGALVTLICLAGILPYLSLQLKAISETFKIMTTKSNYESGSIFDDSTFYIALILAVFAAFFGTQTTDASQKHRGIIVSIALESVLKLVFFLIIGIYVTYYLFDGMSDIITQFSTTKNFNRVVTLGGLEEGFNWFFTIMLSFIAIFLLPRQFQVSVLEINKERHIKTAIWVFPLYLLLFNIFVVFIAYAGKINLGDTVNAEYFSLLLPLSQGHTFLATLVFFGGLSAVISMVIISSLALSIMISNNLIIPYGFLSKFSKSKSDENNRFIKNIRRFAIFFIIIVAYAFYYNFSVQLSLYSIGLTAFVVIAQLAPSFFIGLFWNRGASKGAIIGIIGGFLVAFYTLLLPFTIEAITGDTSFVENGLFSINLLKPHALFGIDFLSPAAHAFFWSFSVNIFLYIYFSLNTVGNYRERNYAEMFVDSKNFSELQDGAYVWKGEAYVDDIRDVLNRFLGINKTEKALRIFFKKYKIPENTKLADARLINFSEQLLTGTIGSASAKMLISNVVKEEELSLLEVLKVLEESKEAIAQSKMLEEKSKELSTLARQLKNANKELIENDLQKDEFLDTVAHELKTPLTGIRASTELLLDDVEMPSEMKDKFLNNMLQDSERLSRLINNILDFEKLATNRQELNFKVNDISKTIAKTVKALQTNANKKRITIKQLNNYIFKLKYDEDRIVQVLVNLISNAIKFCPEETGEIKIDYRLGNDNIEISVSDNGKGIPKEDQDFIFNKFYQSKNQNIIKPEGTGLGLAISKRIIEKHNGKIWLHKTSENGTEIKVKLPI
ncbi:MAG: sensor histidine kinase [Polaribacter sp.]|uniref:sensor histidine kinase n=1 Tax=Polaribacter sp. TaxID=1920175 RepID=UPI0026027A19|nr:sensor histidine kinase [uncultured Polaribacter sp.]